MHLSSAVYGRLRFGTLFICIMIAGASGANGAGNPVARLSLGTTVLASGSTSVASIVFESGESAISALQFELVFDNNAIVNISALTGGAAAAAGKSVVSVLLPNGNLRVLIFGLNQNVIADGTVVDLSIHISPYASPGAYDVRFTNVIAVSATVTTASIQSRNGRIVAKPD